MLFAIAICLAGMTIFASCEKEPDLFDEGVVINGVKWATRNVDKPGIFATTPESTGRFYQWNRDVSYSATGNVSNWDSSTPSNTNWDTENDPSPSGWCIPTYAEIQSLLNENKVSNEWTTQNGVKGMKFTDKNTGAGIFLPAAGYRSYSGGALCDAGENGFYWYSSNTSNTYYGALTLIGNTIDKNIWNTYGRIFGFSIRPVAK